MVWGEDRGLYDESLVYSIGVRVKEVALRTVSEKRQTEEGFLFQ